MKWNNHYLKNRKKEIFLHKLIQKKERQQAIYFYHNDLINL